ncbi:MAG: hypothetical protein K2H53_06915 [Clostridia bacterium]|nr:hypothetical protein [Clostridia bacterium]
MKVKTFLERRKKYKKDIAKGAASCAMIGIVVAIIILVTINVLLGPFQIWLNIIFGGSIILASYFLGIVLFEIAYASGFLGKK